MAVDLGIFDRLEEANGASVGTLQLAKSTGANADLIGKGMKQDSCIERGMQVLDYHILSSDATPWVAILCISEHTRASVLVSASGYRLLSSDP